MLIKAVHDAAIELAVRRPTPEDDGRTFELYPPPKPNEKMVAVSSLAIFERVLLTIPNVTLEEVQDTIMQSLPYTGGRWQ